MAQEQAENSDHGHTSLGGQVRLKLAKLTGISLDEIKLETELIKEVGLDQSTLHDILMQIYDEFSVSAPKKSMSRVEQIIDHITKQKKIRNRTRRKSGGDSEIPYYVQKVFFATNRFATSLLAPEDHFNGNRSKNGKLHYGVAEVNIPRSHKRGVLETPWLNIQFFRDRKQHLFILKLRMKNKDEFFSSIFSPATNEEDILVYVHGFNVRFEDAIKRSAQISVDFGFKGAPFAFSWPSNGNLQSYASDLEDALWSVKHLEGVLRELNAKHPKRRVHIIAHSMGSQVLLRAMRLLSYDRQKDGRPLFETVILCAPDFDSELFAQQIAAEVRGLSNQWVVYASNNDFALSASEQLNSAARLGKPTTYAEGYQIIDASKLEVTPWSVPETHSYYATKKKVLEDMIGAIKGLLPASRGLKEKQTQAGMVWILE